MKNNTFEINSYNEMLPVLLEKYEALLSEYNKLRSENEKLHKQIAELDGHLNYLMEALRLAQYKRFGTSSEKRKEIDPNQLSLFGDFLKDEETTKTDVKEEKTHVSEHMRTKKKKAYALDNLPDWVPVVVVEHGLKEEERLCPACGTLMEKVGLEIVRTLKAKPQEFYVQEDHYVTYACKVCAKDAETTPFVTTPHKKNVIPGGFASEEAIAHIMVQKFVMGIPLYRQEQELRRMGISLSRQTMSNWITKASEELLLPTWTRLHEELLKRDVLHADETTWQVLKEEGRRAETKSYLWLYRTSGNTDKPIVICEYQPSRSGEHARAFLSGFKGYLHTDGYAGYHGFSEDITVVGCWAHARRKFDEAVKALPKGKKRDSIAGQGLALCDELFRLEREFASLTPEERYEARLEKEKPVLNAIWKLTEDSGIAQRSVAAKALYYLKTQWPYLNNYLKDGRLEISNNRAERGIKPFVIDRKNFLFANTPGGAKAGAVIFSLIQTALENKLDPWKYLTWVMQMECSTENIDVETLLPWNAPEEFRTK